MIARIAIAGAIVIVPVAVVAGPALADVPLEPQVTDVSRPHNNNNPWPGWNNNPWSNNNNHNHNHHGDRNRPGRNDNGWQQYVPGGIFGSS